MRKKLNRKPGASFDTPGLVFPLLGYFLFTKIAAMNPIGVTRKDVPAETLDKELEIAKEQLINEGKPADIAEKAAQGKLRRFYEERVLLEQKFVKDNAVTIEQYLKSKGASTVVTFKRFQLGA